MVFGVEQGEGEHRLGVLLGYADSEASTHLRSLQSETGSLFGGGHGRFVWQDMDINAGANLGYDESGAQTALPLLWRTERQAT